MKLELVTRRDVSYVELQRDKKYFLGFSITDGNEEDSRPVVKNIKINSPASKSFAIGEGDVILSVNGCPTTGRKSKDVRRMLDDAGPNVNLQVRYKTHEIRITGSCVYRKQRLTLRLQKIKGSFGFLLRKCSKYSFIMEYPVLSNIKEGSPIHKGHLQDGDRLLKIDNVSLSWMSLPYIASLLQAKDNVEFTFEYSVGVVNFAEMDKKLDLEIDAPVLDIGVSLRMCDDLCPVMYIRSLRQGSVAERCGIFSEGDIILSINDIDTKNLTISKANFLLRRIDKYRKICFISNRTQTDSENKSLSSTENTVSTDDSSIQASDWKHINTPVTPNYTLIEQRRCNFQNFPYIEQIQSLDKFQSILPIMTSLKQTLSALTRQAFRGTHLSVDQNCTYCNNIKHGVKLCTSCLAKMNVSCAQSMDILLDLVIHFVRISSNLYDESDQLLNISLKNVVHTLRETLPNIFHSPEIEEHLCILAEKIACADISCSICENAVKVVVLIVKQLFLILSVRDNSLEFMDLVEHLVCCLLEVKFPCCGYSGFVLNSDTSEKRNSSCEDLSETVCIEADERNSPDTTSNHLKNNSEDESNPLSLESNFNSLRSKIETCRDYLKLTHIQSMSQSKNSTSPNSNNESNKHCESNTEIKILPKKVAGETLLPSFSPDDITGGRTKKFFNNLTHSKIFRSLDSVIRPGRYSDNQNFTQCKIPISRVDAVIINQNLCNFADVKSIVKDLNNNANNVPANQRKKSMSNIKSRIQPLYKKNQIYHDASKANQISVNKPVQSNVNNLQKRISSSSIIGSNEENFANFNSNYTSFSSKYVDNHRNSFGAKQTSLETCNVTLKNEGNGFGLDISDKSICNELPVIEAIEKNSPADKKGLLKVGDRIIAINGVMSSNVSPEQFSVLRNEALKCRTVTLKIEFDVYDEEYKFGTFDVVLDKSLKIGLIFKDMKKGVPLVVKGILKGGAAHRSGQVFPGDEITFVKYQRKEVFDPLPSNFIKEKTIIITVARDPKKVLALDRELSSLLEESQPGISKSSFYHSVSEEPHSKVSHFGPKNHSSSSSQVTILLNKQETSRFMDPALKLPTIRAPSPSLRSSYQSSIYVNPCFQKENVPQNGVDFVVKKTAVHQSRMNSVVLEHEVTLYRDSKSFDFGILLGQYPDTGNAFVKDIRPDGPAKKSGVIQKNSRIVKVNGVLVQGNVYELFHRAENKVDLLIRRKSDV